MAFSLKSIIKTGAPKPPRMVIYGPEGIGKTTFGASAPAPIFLPTEDGTDAVKVDAFPLLKTYAELEDALSVLAKEDHDFQTVVLDSADWAERLICNQVAADYRLPAFDVTAKELSYGRGWRAAGDYMVRLMDGFDYLRNEKGMGIIILAHAQVKRFDDPTTDSYDRYIPDLNKELGAPLSEWADLIGFANEKVAVKEEKVGFNTKKRGMGKGERVLYTQRRPGFNAKSRWAIPDQLPFEYEAVNAALSDAMAATA